MQIISLKRNSKAFQAIFQSPHSRNHIKIMLKQILPPQGSNIRQFEVNANYKGIMQSKGDLHNKVHRTKLSHILLHCCFTEDGCDYVALLSDTSQVSLVSFAEQQFKILAKQTVQVTQALQITSSATGELWLLHLGGVLLWRAGQLKRDGRPQSLNIGWEATPIRLLPLGPRSIAIVCQNNILSFVNERQQISSLPCPDELALKQLKYSQVVGTDLFLLVPSMQLNYPYVFRKEEVLIWQRSCFLKDYINRCKNHYFEDEKVPQYSKICFNSKQKMVYVGSEKQIMVLSVRTPVELNSIFYLSLRMKIKIKTGWCELAMAVSNVMGGVMYANKDRIAQLIPCEYRILRRSIKQKEDSPINNIYYSEKNNVAYLISHNGPSEDLRMYLYRFDQEL